MSELLSRDCLAAPYLQPPESLHSLEIVASISLENYSQFEKLHLFVTSPAQTFPYARVNKEITIRVRWPMAQAPDSK